MNKKTSKNLILMTSRSPEEHKMLSRKGGTNSGISKRRRKEEKEERLALSEILLELLYAEIDDTEIESILDGFKVKFKKNYFAALSAAAIMNGIKNGDIDYLIKIMKALEEKDDKTQSCNMDALIEAVRSVRKHKS